MAHRIAMLALACYAALLLASCGSAPNGAAVQSQAVDGLTIALEAPQAPKLLDQANFVITLTDTTGKPVEGADVYLEMVMGEMKMGTNKPVATADGGGKYRAQGVFDMTGTWHVTVHAHVQGKDHVAAFTSQVDAQQ